jgi:HSP90 family molecular chaperone
MPADLGEAAEDTIATPPVVNTQTLIDDDPETEGSGVTAEELEDLEKDAKDLVKKARDVRATADKKQQDADAAAAKAALSGKAKDIQDAAKKQAEADAAAAKALAAEQLAREALQALTNATAGYSNP